MKFLTAIFYLVASTLAAEISKTYLPLSPEPIDVVIPCASKDLKTLGRCIAGIRQNGANLRRIIVLSKEKWTDEAEWFSEDLFPFSKEEIALEIFGGDREAAFEFIHRPETRIGWLFQQFLKLYVPFVIPDISPNVLILDADVIFLKKVSFMNENGYPYFTPSDEPYHEPYFKHGARLIPGWRRFHKKISGIAHHMLFQKPILEDLFETIRAVHGLEPWIAICRAIDVNDVGFSGMSEYEIYFNYVQLRTSQGIMRPLRWTLSHSIPHAIAYQNAGFTFICCPTWFCR